MSYLFIQGIYSVAIHENKINGITIYRLYYTRLMLEDKIPLLFYHNEDIQRAISERSERSIESNAIAAILVNGFKDQRREIS